MPLRALLQLLGDRVLVVSTFRYCVHILLQLLRAGSAPMPFPCCSASCPLRIFKHSSAVA